MNTVIILDDDKTFTGLLRTIFELEGYRVVALVDPGEVASTARQVKPALVLMDVHTGRGRSTLSALREMRGDATLKRVPVVMTSGMDHGAECLAAGASAFILKPFRPSELLAKVTELVKTGAGQ